MIGRIIWENIKRHIRTNWGKFIANHKPRKCKHFIETEERTRVMTKFSQIPNPTLGHHFVILRLFRSGETVSQSVLVEGQLYFKSEFNQVGEEFKCGFINQKEILNIPITTVK